MNHVRLRAIAFPALLVTCALALAAGCKKESKEPATPGETTAAKADTAPTADKAAATSEQDHEHDETPLGEFAFGAMKVALAQGHGPVLAGKESHLVVKLPYNDKGASVVRAWLGTKDRTLSFVGKGRYAPSHDDYDIHAMAPNPLPDGMLWWVEIEKPDGTKIIGSAPPKVE